MNLFLKVVSVDFDKTGRKFATACTDGLAKVFDLSHNNGKPTSILSGHTKELSKVSSITRSLCN